MERTNVCHAKLRKIMPAHNIPFQMHQTQQFFQKATTTFTRKKGTTQMFHCPSRAVRAITSAS